MACLAEMIRHCGQSVRVDVSEIFFSNVDPSSNQRMDLVVYDPGQPNALYDVVVTNPVSQEVLVTNCVNTRATQVQEQVKERCYKSAAAAAGMSLHGLAIQVYGAWGNDFTDMLTHFISLGAIVTQIPKAILANYWRRRISVSQNSVLGTF